MAYGAVKRNWTLEEVLMKTIIAALLLSVTASSYAVTLSKFTINRSGGGQLDATINSFEDGVVITLNRCSFREVPRNVTGIVSGKDTILDALAILEGKAILAINASPVRPNTATGTWFEMSYTYNTAQFGSRHADLNITEFVKSPIVVIDGKVSDVLAELESQARDLCRNF